MATSFAENFYSFRAYHSVLEDLNGIAASDIALVSAIEAALLQASQSYTARNYRASIDAYLRAQGLILHTTGQQLCPWNSRSDC
jgi:hypothetical protein